MRRAGSLAASRRAVAAATLDRGSMEGYPKLAFSHSGSYARASTSVCSSKSSKSSKSSLPSTRGERRATRVAPAQAGSRTRTRGTRRRRRARRGTSRRARRRRAPAAPPPPPPRRDAVAVQEREDVLRVDVLSVRVLEDVQPPLRRVDGMLAQEQPVLRPRRDDATGVDARAEPLGREHVRPPRVARRGFEPDARLRLTRRDDVRVPRVARLGVRPAAALQKPGELQLQRRRARRLRRARAGAGGDEKHVQRAQRVVARGDAAHVRRREVRGEARVFVVARVARVFRFFRRGLPAVSAFRVRGRRARRSRRPRARAARARRRSGTRARACPSARR